MKREVVIVLIFLFLIFSILMVSADEAQQKAYSWLNSKTDNSTKCEDLTLEQQIFSLLSTGNCEHEILKANASGQK